MLENFAVFALGFVLLIVFSAIKILKEYERGVIFQLGRFWKVKGPGLILVIPVLQQIDKRDLRVVVMDVPTQDVISRDNVSVKVNAVVYFRIVDPEKAVIQVENVYEATSQLARIARFSRPSAWGRAIPTPLNVTAAHAGRASVAAAAAAAAAAVRTGKSARKNLV